MKKLNQNGFTPFEVVLLILVLVALGFAGYVVYQRGKNAGPTNQTVVQTKKDTTKPAPITDKKKATYEGQQVSSGQNRFTMVIPNGWSEIIRPMDGNWLLLPGGTKQPVYNKNQSVKITDLPSFGSDSQRVFTVLVHDNIAAPEGSPSEFVLPNNGQPITGTKYSLTYTDTLEGLGGHQKGEKRYEYWFKLKDGNNLVIWYSVYADDLNDQNAFIDEVVRTIVVKN
jgi:hypothetical protein